MPVRCEVELELKPTVYLTPAEVELMLDYLQQSPAALLAGYKPRAKVPFAQLLRNYIEFSLADHAGSVDRVISFTDRTQARAA